MSNGNVLLLYLYPYSDHLHQPGGGNHCLLVLYGSHPKNGLLCSNPKTSFLYGLHLKMNFFDTARTSKRTFHTACASRRLSCYGSHPKTGNDFWPPLSAFALNFSHRYPHRHPRYQFLRSNQRTRLVLRYPRPRSPVRLPPRQ